DRDEAMLGGKRKRGAVAGRQQLILAFIAAAPDRSDRMDDVLRLEAIAAGDLRRSGFAAAERAAFRKQLGPGGAVDGAVDTAAAPTLPLKGRAIACGNFGFESCVRERGWIPKLRARPDFDSDVAPVRRKLATCDCPALKGGGSTPSALRDVSVAGALRWDDKNI